MDDFIVTLIQFVCLYYITKVFVNGMLILMEGKRQAKMDEMAKFDEMTHRVKVEKHGEMYYWYDEDDGEFLGQGKDMETVVTIIKSRFPTHIFFLTGEQALYKLHAPTWTLTPFDIKIYS